jgi:hypothetical protein
MVTIKSGISLKLGDDYPYVPVNSPALGDMMDMFDFDK